MEASGVRDSFDRGILITVDDEIGYLHSHPHHRWPVLRGR